MRCPRAARAVLASTLALSLCEELASSQTGLPITGSRHDFRSGGILHQNGNMVTYGSCAKCHAPHGGSLLPDDKCSMCHVAHRPKRVSPLWARADPDGASWLLWNGLGGQLLDGSQDSTYLSAGEFAASGSGLCLSCHDSGVAAATHDLSNSHPLAKIIPFGTPGWQASLSEGNLVSGSNVLAETRSSVGCTSCHSIHRGAAADAKLRRSGEFCASCHDR